ncbi:hypothetical protein [Neobacillus mesonae]|uniref:hypothetical protein n=1 Tax=Neobacillus mesonae TaxID=1193713 RepID=UPI002573F601|nr:hypothetical protein [Neobacillus mesonae]
MCEILSFCNEVLNEKEIVIPLELTNDPNFEMYYDFEQKKIFINENRIRDNYKKYNAPLLKYVRIILYHELGHALDNSLKDINEDIDQCYTKINENPLSNQVSLLYTRINKNSLQAEINAWSIAETLKEPQFTNLFFKVKKNELKQHKVTSKLEKKRIILNIEKTKGEINLINLRDQASKL